MQDLFNSIIKAYSSLWHVRVLGDSIEIITPMVATEEEFVSVFVTKRGDYYVVTDGGWISSGYYECDVDNLGRVYQKLFQYYLDNYAIQQTWGHGRKLYYKKVKTKELVVNAVFELSHFISAVVSGAGIQFSVDKKEQAFRKTVRDYLSTEFEVGLFEFDKKLTSESSIAFSAVSHIGGHLQLVNIVTGSTVGYYRDSLCRANMFFDYADSLVERLRINKKISLLDDSIDTVYNTPAIREFINLSRERGNNQLLPWSMKGKLGGMLVTN